MGVVFLFFVMAAWWVGNYTLMMVTILLWIAVSWSLKLDVPRYSYGQLPITYSWKKFPDVSFYQGNISWATMVTNTDAIIIRGGQNVWEDSKFKEFYAAAREKGMYRGIYWFYDDRKSPQEQFNVLKGLIGDDIPEIGIFIDWERSYGGAHGDLRDVVAWMQLAEAAYPGTDVGFYTGYFWFVAHTSPVKHAAQFEYLKSHPLWLAWYTEDFADVLIPRPWTKITYWQWGTPAWAWGQETLEIDMNYFIGTDQEFYEKVGGKQPMAKNKVTVTFDQGARERQEPHAAGVYGTILQDNSVHYSDFDPVPDMDDPTNPDKKWIKLQSGWYIATRYPVSTGGSPVRAIVEPLGTVPPEKHLLEVYVDGVLEFTKEF